MSFNFLDNYCLFEIRPSVDENWILAHGSFGHFTKSEFINYLKRTKNEYSEVTNKFINILEKSDFKNRNEYFKRNKIKFFEFRKGGSLEGDTIDLVITMKYETEDSIYLFYIGPRIIKNAEYYQILLEKFAITVERSYDENTKYYHKAIIDHISSNNIKPENFGYNIGLYKFAKENKYFKKSLEYDKNISRILFKNNKLVYDNSDEDMDFTKLTDLYYDFLIEEISHDTYSLDSIKENEITIEDAKNTVMDYIRGFKSRKSEIEFCLVYQENGDIKGFSFGGLNKEIGYYRISTLYVKPSSRNKGISSKFFRFHESLAKENNLKSIRISTLGGNKKAYDIYTKHFGFQEVIRTYIKEV